MKITPPCNMWHRDYTFRTGAVDVGVGVIVRVGVACGSSVGVMVGVGVSDGVYVGAGVTVGAAVYVADGVGVGLSAAMMSWNIYPALMRREARSVSIRYQSKFSGARPMTHTTVPSV